MTYHYINRSPHDEVKPNLKKILHGLDAEHGVWKLSGSFTYQSDSVAAVRKSQNLAFENEIIEGEKKILSNK